MRVLPENVNGAWIDSLTDSDLLDVEARVRKQFGVLERREKKLRGAKYSLMTGSDELMLAWDRMSRLQFATNERSLKLLRKDPDADSD
jgi:hypothetical protein